MSLINEALKRARLEAARQDASERGYIVGSDEARYRSKPPWWRRNRTWMWGSLILLLIALLGVTFTRILPPPWSNRLDKSDLDALPSTTSPVIPEASSKEQSLIGVTTSYLSATAAFRPASRADSTGEPSQSGQAEVAQEELQPSSQPTSSSPTRASSFLPSPITKRTVTTPKETVSAEVKQSASTSSRAATDLSKEPELEVYQRDFTLKDGSRVELGGIAWSESGPYALVDGRVIGVGEFVGDFVVETIGPTQILLKSRTRRVQLEVR